MQNFHSQNKKKHRMKQWFCLYRRKKKKKLFTSWYMTVHDNLRCRKQTGSMITKHTKNYRASFTLLRYVTTYLTRTAMRFSVWKFLYTSVLASWNTLKLNGGGELKTNKCTLIFIKKGKETHSCFSLVHIKLKYY